MTTTLPDIFSVVGYVMFWLIVFIIWSTIMGNSRPFLSAIVQQVTLFSVLNGLGYFISPDLSEPVAALSAIGIVIISEIFIFKLVVPTPMPEDRVFFGICLTIAIPVGFIIAVVSGEFVGLRTIHM